MFLDGLAGDTAIRSLVFIEVFRNRVFYYTRINQERVKIVTFLASSVL